MDLEKEGFDILGMEERNMLDELFESYFPKIKRLIKNNLTLKLQLRMHEKKKGKKYSIHVEAIYPGRIITAQAHDYDLERTAHKAMKRLDEEIRHKFKIS